MPETPPPSSKDSTNLVTEGMAFLNEDELIRFEQIENLMADIVITQKTSEFLRAVLNCPTVNDGRKLMVIQILVIQCAKLFTSDEFRGLILLLGFYTRQSRDLSRFQGERVVPYSSAPSLVVQIREHTGSILRESVSLLNEIEADKILASHPFFIEDTERARILKGVYIHDF